MDYNQAALQMHEEHHGKVAVQSKVKVENRDDLSTAYTPGVAEPCRRIHADPRDVYRYTAKGNLVAVVSDGTAVLGLGDIGPLAAMPVMEGKAILFKEFADVDAFPICLDTKDVDEIVRTVKAIAPTFGGINLEDISAPRCFEIESRLPRTRLPAFHHIPNCQCSSSYRDHRSLPAVRYEHRLPAPKSAPVPAPKKPDFRCQGL